MDHPVLDLSTAPSTTLRQVFARWKKWNGRSTVMPRLCSEALPAAAHSFPGERRMSPHPAHPMNTCRLHVGEGSLFSAYRLLQAPARISQLAQFVRMTHPG